MNLILDVSGAMPFILDDQRRALTADLIFKADTVIVPEIFVAELGNVLWKYVRFNGIEETEAHRALQIGLDMADKIIPNASIIDDALVLAVKTSHPVYDCLYLTLALKMRYGVLTQDKKLRSLGDSLGIEML